MGEYTWQAVVNITAEAMTVVYLLVLITHIHRSMPTERRKQQSFLWICTALFFINFSDMLFRIYENRPGMAVAVLMRVCAFIIYAGYILGVLIYINYLLQYLGYPKDTGRIPLAVLLILTISNFMLLCITQVNGFFYYIDYANHYHRSPGMQYLAVTLVLEIVAAIAILILGRKKMSVSERVSSYIYAAIPLVAGFLQLANYGVVYINVSCGVAAYILYFNIQAKREQEYFKQQKEVTDQQVALMISQIQPHFLYNAISSIRELCLIDATEARDVLGDFAMYLRSNMDSIKSTGLIPFEKELEHVRHYLKIEQLRFGDLLNVEYDIETIDFEIPSLCLEPIVENAVKHGTCSKDEGGTVTIITRAYADVIEIIVKDDGEGIDCPTYEDLPLKHDGRSHVGIENVKSRVEGIARGQLLFTSEKGVGTTVRIVIPTE